MKIAERIDALQALGVYLKTIDGNELDTLTDRARAQNSWFTAESIKLGVAGLVRYLDSVQLERWMSTGQSTQSTESTNAGKKVGIVMAGNIPFVGFHDLLTVLITGNVALVKLSSKDAVLIPYLVEKLVGLEPRFREQVQFVEQLKNFDAVIATGSDNSARYFEYYFGKYPHVIRKNRTSCAVMTGQESREDLLKLGHDVFSYFGLGCRNVSKLYVPAGYDFKPILGVWDAYSDITHHNKYHNNYDYQKSILLVNLIPFLDNGFVMVTESERMVSPISVVYFEHYANEADLREKLIANADKIQCIVGNHATATVSFGQAQYPALWDYADQVNTLEFLTTLR
jgi:hypothetical protein